ncbi:TRAP transporter large permease [Pseudogemmobacter faecipullorum]|uniref:TRAP transporter large permease protein n=1 Tax=Pseudogemmobacter faecipullorum TaxID=2755041 RepID=A0ABS8CLY6_9RHOB|nr:TRAP transporter large permease [Pseudogemmobacter faecipullorum]MCB5410403.1 TRAP transporter large permease [Pseudogemmobacter faecipullorum]
MERLEIGFAGVAMILVLIGIRVPIGVAMGSTAFFGIWAMMGFNPAVGIAKAVPFTLIGDWNLSAIPMFLFMGFVAVEAGLSKGLFGAARIFLARIPGGLASSTVFASALFGAASGSSVATSAAFSRIAVPEMLKGKYDPGLATGSVAAAGTLAALIPPSVLMIVYCLLVDTSINTVFMAGVVPGILTAVAFIGMITIRCMLNPNLAPRYTDTTSRAEKIRLLRDAWPLPVITAIVMGGIFSGAFTATESGAVGAFLACLIAFIRGTMSFGLLKRSLIDTAVGTSAIFMIVVGAALFTRFVALATIPTWVMTFFDGMSPTMVVVLICLILILMGTFMEEISIMLLTMPVLLPLLISLNIDLTWFGILVIKVMTIGLISPPVGMNVFVIKSSLGDKVTINQIFGGVSWFIAIEFVMLAVLIAWPQITLWLPNLMLAG